MTEKFIFFDGYKINLNFYQEGDGSIRVEAERDITGKRLKVFPDNKINLDK